MWSKGDGFGGDKSEDFLVLSSKRIFRDNFERWAGDTVLGLFHRFVGRHFKVSFGSSSLKNC